MSFDSNYFSTHAYKGVTFSRLSQYWWSNRFYGAMIKRLAKKGTKLLEIGCGLGHLVGQLEMTFSTIATDVNTWALTESMKIASRTPHIVSDAEDQAFGRGIFSTIICKHVVEHIQNPGKAILEMGRITAPGGILLISTPNLDSTARKWKKEKWIGYQDPTHISLKTPAEWIEMISLAGFEIIRIFSDGFWDAPYIPFFPKILQKIIFGLPGGIQAVFTIPFLPVEWGESIIIIARKLLRNE